MEDYQHTPYTSLGLFLVVHSILPLKGHTWGFSPPCKSDWSFTSAAVAKMVFQSSGWSLRKEVIDAVCRPLLISCIGSFLYISTWWTSTLWHACCEFCLFNSLFTKPRWINRLLTPSSAFRFWKSSSFDHLQSNKKVTLIINYGLATEIIVNSPVENAHEHTIMIIIIVCSCAFSSSWIELRVHWIKCSVKWSSS